MVVVDQVGVCQDAMRSPGKPAKCLRLRVTKVKLLTAAVAAIIEIGELLFLSTAARHSKHTKQTLAPDDRRDGAGALEFL